MFAGGQRNWNKSVRVEIQFFGKGSQLHAVLTRISKLRQFFIGNLRNEDDGGWRKIIKGDIRFRFEREREKKKLVLFFLLFFSYFDCRGAKAFKWVEIEFSRSSGFDCAR